MPFNQFYEAIVDARERTGTSKGGAWYRGISDGRHTLIPSLFRVKNRHFHAEINVFADFWTMIEEPSIMDSWQRLSFMQHFGVPTRLLDWTSDLNIALYFAISHAERRGPGDPCIWVLNPFKLNAMYCGVNKIFDEVDRISFDYYTEALTGIFPNVTPIAMRPMWSNNRIRAQSGAFTFHGSSEVPLETLVRSKVAKRVQIQHSAVRLLREKLVSEGLNNFTVFGGADGLAQYLKSHYFGSL